MNCAATSSGSGGKKKKKNKHNNNNNNSNSSLKNNNNHISSNSTVSTSNDHHNNTASSGKNNNNNNNNNNNATLTSTQTAPPSGQAKLPEVSIIRLNASAGGSSTGSTSAPPLSGATVTGTTTPAATTSSIGAVGAGGEDAAHTTKGSANKKKKKNKKNKAKAGGVNAPDAGSQSEVTASSVGGGGGGGAEVGGTAALSETANIVAIGSEAEVARAAEVEPAGPPAVTVIPLNKDPGAIPPHLNPAVVISQRSDSQVPKVIEASPVVTLIGSNKKAKGHGALYNPPPPPKVAPSPSLPTQEEPQTSEQVQTISGGFKFPSSLQPVFETPESIAVSTGVVLDQETSGVLTIVPVRSEGERKRRNRNKIVPPCCELRGKSGLEVVCPHSNKPIPNYNFIVNEDKEKSRQLLETQESLQHIDDPEVLDSLASIDHSVTIKLVGGGVAPQKTVHREDDKHKTILVEAADAMKKTGNVPAGNSGNDHSKTSVAGAPLLSAKMNGALPEDDAKAEKARLKAERKAAFEAKRAAELASSGAEGKENKKEMTKAERRALQEAQRAQKNAEAKGSAKDGGKGVKSKEDSKATGREPPKKETSPTAENKKKESSINKKVSFADLPPIKSPFANMHTQGEHVDKLYRFTKDTGLHPAVLQLGFQIAEGVVASANNRCTAMLEALQKLVQDFAARKDQEPKDVRQLAKELGDQIDYNVAFLDQCRPLSVSMSNALMYVKAAMGEECSEPRCAAEFASTVEETMARFVQIEIDLARRAIVDNAKTKITDGDVVLIFARSALVRDILITSHREGRQFSVIVVDSRPRLEGRETLRMLCREGILCKYVFIHSVSYIIKEVTKVLLGADTLLANGYVASKVGSSQIAMIAKTFNVPVLVCCETYKFSDKVLADPFVGNELDSQRDFLLNLNEDRRKMLCKDLSPTVSLIGITYDITPPEFVTVVVTERGSLPCTSVPVVLRVRQNVLQ